MFKEVNMEKIYRHENGIIVVTSPETRDQEKLRRVTEEFVKKVIRGGKKYGNTNSTRNLNEK